MASRPLPENGDRRRSRPVRDQRPRRLRQCITEGDITYPVYELLDAK